MGSAHRHVWTLRFLCSGGGLAAALGCAGLPEGAPTLSEPPSEAAQQEAAPWIAAEALPALDCEEHGATLAWLALEGPPAIVAQALDGLARCADAPDRDALAVHRLAHEDPAVAGAALPEEASGEGSEALLADGIVS